MLEEPECHKRKCIHFHGVKQPDGTEMSEVVYCKAFPDGIPEDIAYGGNGHTEKHKDQVGAFVFTPD